MRIRRPEQQTLDRLTTRHTASRVRAHLQYLANGPLSPPTPGCLNGWSAATIDDKKKAAPLGAIEQRSLGRRPTGAGAWFHRTAASENSSPRADVWQRQQHLEPGHRRREHRGARTAGSGREEPGRAARGRSVNDSWPPPCRRRSRRGQLYVIGQLVTSTGWASAPDPLQTAGIRESGHWQSDPDRPEVIAELVYLINRGAIDSPIGAGTGAP